MKVALHVDGPVIRGNEHQVIALAAGLRNRGHEVHASCRAGGPVEAALRAHDIVTTGVRPRGDVDVFSTLRFASWLHRLQPDALLLTSWVRLVNGARAASLARVPHVVFRLGGLQPIAHRKRAAERRALLHRVDAIIANSELVAARVREAVPARAHALSIVPNGIEVSSPEPEPVPTLRAAMSIPGDALLAVAVGGLEHNKGFDVLIRALADVHGVHVALVGGGTPEQIRAMNEGARASAVADRTHFMGRRDDIDAVLKQCDLFVMPSRSEGFSVARLEAMRAGVPVVATDTGGSIEGTAPFRGRPAAGWVVPSGDPAALALAMSAVRDAIRRDDPAVDAAIAEGVWRVHNWFSMERMIDGYEAVLTNRITKGTA